MVRGAGVSRDGSEDKVAPVMGKGRGNVKTPSPMPGPGGTNLGRVVSNDELACGVDGMGGEIKGATMDAVPCRFGWVWDKGAEVVERELS